MELVTAKELIRAGDVFLVKFVCPFCQAEVLEGIPLKHCSECKAPLTSVAISVKESNKRVLAGSVRTGKHVTKKIIRHLQGVQDGVCGYCSGPLGDYHVDHIFPMAAGGTNNIDNLVLSCPRCNLLASSFVFTDFYAKRAFVLSRRKLG